MSDNQKVLCHFLGLIDYKEAWDFQETIFKSSIDLKIARRNGETEELPKHQNLLQEVLLVKEKKRNSLICMVFKCFSL